ncbi:hypothetical protein [Rodentibacter pneumotropicus]|uniref:Uncharacterized protein n=1 Tax=Rodentibacter pneumotropicus TaxID=758 RepID=A0A4S2Q2K7_9PAST|nr:hypothetical protein [Rodentibacter pneumotropicus]THA10762.1 hypothetical protein D3M78_02225 [Rodentibacter pneumotropicus]
MTNEQDSVAKTIAHFLATARYLAVLNIVLFAISLTTTHYIGLNTVLAVGLLYLHIRLEFDQRVFMHTTNFINFDRTLLRLGLVNKITERDIFQRAKGAIRLWYAMLFATLIQLALWLI